MWVAVFTAFVPLLAIPTILTKIIIITASIVMAGIAYSLVHRAKISSDDNGRSKRASRLAPASNDPTPKPTIKTKPAKQKSVDKKPDDEAEPEELTEEEIKKQFFNISSTKSKEEKEEKKKDVNKKDDTPVNVTDPNSDRFIAMNTYKSRVNRMRK
jgi:hypothetical protein